MVDSYQYSQPYHRFVVHIPYFTGQLSLRFINDSELSSQPNIYLPFGVAVAAVLESAGFQAWQVSAQYNNGVDSCSGLQYFLYTTHLINIDCIHPNHTLQFSCMQLP